MRVECRIVTASLEIAFLPLKPGTAVLSARQLDVWHRPKAANPYPANMASRPSKVFSCWRGPLVAMSSSGLLGLAWEEALWSRPLQSKACADLPGQFPIVLSPALTCVWCHELMFKFSFAVVHV